MQSFYRNAKLRSSIRYRRSKILSRYNNIDQFLFYEQIQDYLEQNNLFDFYESAYRRDHFTQACLVRVLDDMRHAAMDNRQVTVSVFFNLFKAFDKVQHSIFIKNS